MNYKSFSPKPAAIYVTRGLEPGLAKQVAEQLMTKDALAAHARDELGISEMITARPIQAALTSAATFVVGAANWPTWTWKNGKQAVGAKWPHGYRDACSHIISSEA